MRSASRIASRRTRKTPRLAAFTERLTRSDPRASLARARAELDRLTPRLAMAMRGQLDRGAAERARLTTRSIEAMHVRVDRAGHALAMIVARADALSPLAVLARGYAIAIDPRGRAVTDAREVRVGELVDVRVERGRFAARVERTEEA
jgi:exodeoxyribonuclease VII large subunit